MRTPATAFGEVAELYDRRRPGCPDGLIDDILAALPPLPGDAPRQSHLATPFPARVVDVGCGTGQATRALARRGAEVVGIEPDAAMADVARRRCADLGNVSIITTRFEEWRPDPFAFDAVVSGQAWHWIEPAAGFIRARQALADDGVLALYWHAPRAEGFYAAPLLVDAYRAVLPDLVSVWDPTSWEADMKAQAELVSATDFFAEPDVTRYDWDVQYSFEEFVELHLTYSGHRMKTHEELAALFERFATIVASAGGRITVAYRTFLLLSRALPLNG